MGGLTEGGKWLLGMCMQPGDFARASMNAIEITLADPDRAARYWGDDVRKHGVHPLDRGHGVVASDYPFIKAHLMLTGHWKVT